MKSKTENTMNRLFEIPTVVLVRHAQSRWNRDGRFTGWANPALTDEGLQEAEKAGVELGRRNFQFDRVYSSRLTRARETAEIIINTSANGGQPIVEDWRLNERHYGALQGRYREEVISRMGEKQVWRWRRSYKEMPPAMSCNDDYYPANQATYNDIPVNQLPAAESLELTQKRAMSFWDDTIKPQIEQGRQILISSHGNTLRGLIMSLSGMSVDEVEQFEIPTAQPIVYAFSRNAEPLGWHYLDDQPGSEAA